MGGAQGTHSPPCWLRVLLGPSHFVAVDGFALSGAEAFSTPLGEIPVDRRGEESIRGVPRVVDHERAHEREHSLEVELPFLQSVLGDFELVPVVVGEASPARVAAVLDLLWGGAETLIVVSSDLSHFYDYREAQRQDPAIPWWGTVPGRSSTTGRKAPDPPLLVSTSHTHLQFSTAALDRRSSCL